MVRRALLLRAYNLIGRGKWTKKVLTVGDELMGEIKDSVVS